MTGQQLSRVPLPSLAVFESPRQRDTVTQIVRCQLDAIREPPIISKKIDMSSNKVMHSALYIMWLTLLSSCLVDEKIPFLNQMQSIQGQKQLHPSCKAVPAPVSLELIP